MKHALAAAAALLAVALIMPEPASAQGIMRGAYQGAAIGKRAAGPIGAVFGGTIGGFAGGIAGGIKGIFGIPQKTAWRHRSARHVASR